MIAVLMGVISPVLLGYLVVALLLPSSTAALRIFLGAGVGAGITSCIFFLSLVAGISALPLETAVLVIAGLLFLRRRAISSPPRTGWTVNEKVLGAAFAFALAAALLAFVAIVRRMPNGGWDGWMIWNTHARFLSTAGWRDAFSPSLFYIHPDYPLLLPAFIARTWTLNGTWDLTTPVLASGLFTFATVGVLVASLCSLRNRALGFLAGIILISTHFFITQGAAEYADVPVAFFFLATCAAFAMSHRTGGHLWLAGLFAALSAWTKNEGWVLIAAIAVVALSTLFLRGRANYFRRALEVAAGALPVLAVVFCFRHTFATTNDYVSSRSFRSLVAILSNPERYTALLRELYPELLAILITCILLRRFRPIANRSIVVPCAAVLAIIFVGYCATILTTPYDIHWQIATALNRLLLQLFPAALFTVALAIKDPETVSSSTLNE